MPPDDPLAEGNADESITVVADAASVGLDAGSIRYGQTIIDALILISMSLRQSFKDFLMSVDWRRLTCPTKVVRRPARLIPTFVGHDKISVPRAFLTRFLLRLRGRP